MDPILRSQYQHLLSEVEEPIREIVNAIWGLEFVVDTGYSCCGHVRTTNFMGGIAKGVANYPHRTMLEIAYSLDPAHLGRRLGFDQALRAVVVNKHEQKLCFNNIWEYESATLPYSRVPQPNYSVLYQGDIGGKDKTTMQRVLETEELLVDFWEAVATAVRHYNPRDKIGPIKGKSFQQVINWAHWGTTHPNIVTGRFG
ncbi:hypothetical protein HYV86_03705 [Candidatus Woesearchaeota archaeon]|nr:hypothetical protein [Candidatus Woesearchaeota archaeon]